MIVLGVVLLLLYYLILPVQIVYVAGVILLVLGLVFLVLGFAGHPVRGRTWY